MSNKLVVGSLIMIFWLLVPYGMMLVDEGGSSLVDTTWIEDMQEPTALDFLSVMFQYLINYFFILFIFIPGVSIYTNVIIIAVKFMSGLTLLLIARGN